MLSQFISLVFLKAFAFQFINYALLTIAFFSFFALINTLMETKIKRVKTVKN